MTDFLAKGTTITGTYYDSLLHKLREAIKLKRRGMPTREVSHKTMPQSTTLILSKQKHSLVAMKSFHTPIILLTWHHMTFTCFQPWSHFWREHVSQMKQWFPKWSHAWGSTHQLSQTRPPELHKTVGKVYNSWWYLCRERLITVPSFVCLSLSEVGQAILVNVRKRPVT